MKTLDSKQNNFFLFLGMVTVLSLNIIIQHFLQHVH
jgi:hypothetical protein